MSDKKFELTESARTPTEFLRMIEAESFLDLLESKAYPGATREDLSANAARYRTCIELHLETFGNRPGFLLRAPGRLNLFTEYLDMCGGDHLSATMDRDIPAFVSPAPERNDVVRVTNISPLFPDGEFSVKREFGIFSSGSSARTAAGWKEQSWQFPHRNRPKGDWLNYLIGPWLRASWKWPEIAFRGADITVGESTVPIRAGTSSSSALVVLSFLSFWLSNQDRLPETDIRRICQLLGEAEWYVGTRGGANDQTTILRGAANGILYNLHHLPLLDSRVLPWIHGVDMVLCNSLWEADKALGANLTFNLRMAWIELTEVFLSTVVPALTRKAATGNGLERGWISRFVREKFGYDPADSFPVLESDPTLLGRIADRLGKLGTLDATLLDVNWDVAAELPRLLPERITMNGVGRTLAMSRDDAARRYAVPGAGESEYKLRQTALFFLKENRLSRELEKTLIDAQSRLEAGEITTNSVAYQVYRDKIAVAMNNIRETLRNDFEVSSPQLERLVAIALRGPGTLGVKLTGAGGGGCICILVRKETSSEMLDWLDREYFGKPENFREYRAVIERLSESADEAEKAVGREKMKNLEEALAHPEKQRMTIRFSSGAGPIHPPE